MNSNSVVQILFRRTHLHSHRKALDDLIGSKTEDVNTNVFLFWTSDDEFIYGRFFFFFWYLREVERAEG